MFKVKNEAVTAGATVAAYAFLGAIFLMFHVGRSNMKLEAAGKIRAPKVGGSFNVPLF